MIFSSITSLNMYTKNMKMEQKWQRRVQNSDYASQNNSQESASSGGIDPLLKRQLEDLRDSNNPETKTKESIKAKMAAGKKLSSAEMKYLQEKDPATYQKAKELEMTRKKYQEELKRCKTKEDVQRLKMSYTAQSMETVNSTANNPNIPKGQKLAIIAAENQKMNAVADATNQFIKEGHYSKLPTEAEQQKAEKEMQEALEAERNERNDASLSRPEDSEEATSDGQTPEAAAGEDKDAAKKAETPVAGTDKTAEQTGRQKAPSRAEAEYSPEAMKVKRAKAKANYEKSCTAETPLSANDIFAVFDVKA